MAISRFGVTKQGNEYARAFGKNYARIPKAIFAAVAYSSISSGGDFQEFAIKNFMHEWEILYQNGIVPQKPIKEKNDLHG